MLKLDIQMFAVPFRKVSKTRKRTSGEMIKPHRVCKKCGSYKKQTVIEVKEA